MTTNSCLKCDDKDIHCFKEKQPCHGSLEMLAERIELATGQEENPFQVDPDEITEAAPQELIVDEDEEGDSDIDIVVILHFLVL